MKPGFQTSEFWLSVATIAVQILHKQLGITTTPTATLSAVTGIYTLSRSILKIKVPKP